MNTGEILIYQNPEGSIKIDVRLEDETVWLTQAQLCELLRNQKPLSVSILRTYLMKANLSKFQLFGISEQLLPMAKTTIPGIIISMLLFRWVIV